MSEKIEKVMEEVKALTVFNTWVNTQEQVLVFGITMVSDMVIARAIGKSYRHLECKRHGTWQEPK